MLVVVSDTGQSSDTDSCESGNMAPISRSTALDYPFEEPPRDDLVEARFQDALERVAHGATVSIPAIILKKGLFLVFTVILTNGFTAGSYGLFALAYRVQAYLVELAGGFEEGLNRFLPIVESAADQDIVVTIAASFMMSTSVLLGGGLFLASPFITSIADYGPEFHLFIRIFAIGVPVGVWFVTLRGILRGLEEVGPLNLMTRVVHPTAQLIVGGLGAFIFHDLVLIAEGLVFIMALISIAVSGWLVRVRGLRPRIYGGETLRYCRRYVRFTAPLFGGRFARTIQTYGFYFLIIAFLHGSAGGVFVVGVLVGTFVHLPLLGINQFIRPVAAKLQEQDHDEALRRLYQVTSRLVLIGVTGLAIPAIVYRADVMRLFGRSFVEHAALLPGFIVAHYVACAAGSVGGMLWMTDHSRAFFAVNVGTTIFLVITAIPLTFIFGLGGLVVSYLLMRLVNNGLEMVALYYLEGLQPFTRLHGKPLMAAVPMTVVILASPIVLPATVAPFVGTLVGLTVYAVFLRALGFTQIEHRLATSIINRCLADIPKFNACKTVIHLERNVRLPFLAVSIPPIVGGIIQVIIGGARLTSGATGLFSLFVGTILLVISALRAEEKGD